MFDELHWLPLHSCIQFKILTLIFKAQRALAPKYLFDVIRRPRLIQLPLTVHFVL